MAVTWLWQSLVNDNRLCLVIYYLKNASLQCKDKKKHQHTSATIGTEYCVFQLDPCCLYLSCDIFIRQDNDIVQAFYLYYTKCSSSDLLIICHLCLSLPFYERFQWILYFKLCNDNSIFVEQLVYECHMIIMIKLFFLHFFKLRYEKYPLLRIHYSRK